MNENTLTPEQPVSNLPLLDRYEKKYRDALSVIDNEVKDLIQNGQEMKGLLLFSQNESKIDEVHEALTNLYTIVYGNEKVLKAYGSKRLKQLNQELKPILKFIGDSDTDEEKEEYILKGLREVGSLKFHPIIDARKLNELLYMLRTLRILVEPEFDIQDASEEEGEDESD